MSKPARPAVDRVLERTAAGEGGCVIFTGPRKPKGYGTVWDNGRTRTAHRVVYEALVGPIPTGMAVCHSCDNPSCVNPAHLWVGSAADNNRDRKEKGRYPWGRTQCPHGHPYDEANTYVKGNKRSCRACNRARYHRNKMGAALDE